MSRGESVRRAAGAAASPALAQEPLFREKYRPQFHFTPKKGWQNDPNGLVFYQGEYHLFFQHNPFDTKWGNMTWGHAISTDLVHWTQMANALEPDRMGTMFSGSAVVDWNNTAGFQKGVEKTLVAIYTAAGGTSPESKGQPFTQCIAYSTDRGRTWTKYAGNPVVPHMAGSNRDPKVVWHAPTRRWIMALYLDANDFCFLSSPDLKTWTKLHDITVPGCAECPDFFEIAVEGETDATKWVWTAANGRYLVGTFDGNRFIPEVMTQPGHHGQNYYAVQTYSDLPKGRRIQLGWMNGSEFPGMPFSQQMSFPYELKLRRTAAGLKLCGLPVKEVELLHGTRRTWQDLELKPGDNPLANLSGELWDISAVIEPAGASEVGFSVRGWRVGYRVKEKQLVAGSNPGAAMPAQGGRIMLRLLVDRTSIETFGNDGEVVMPNSFLPKDEDEELAIYAAGGPAKIVSLTVWPMRRAWPD
jgi:sucrose-6-phosphate hydrolase SacC (GH32 family)